MEYLDNPTCKQLIALLADILVSSAHEKADHEQVQPNTDEEPPDLQLAPEAAS